MAFGKLLAGLECRRLGYDGVSPLVDRLSLGAYNRRFRPNRTSADWLSRDEEQVDAYLADPLCSHKSSVSMFRDMMGGLQYIARRENLARMDPDTPGLFLLWGPGPSGRHGKRGAQSVRHVPGGGLPGRDPEAVSRRPTRDV